MQERQENNMTISAHTSILFKQEKDCCGCTACLHICPRHAISLTKNTMGETFPSIDVNLCINCGLCNKTCPIQSKNSSDSSLFPLVYAARAKDIAIVKYSSSGGIFTVITDHILNQGGAIASAIYNYDSQQLEYRLYQDFITRDQARGSKYIQPVLGDIFDQCIQWLHTNPQKPLLFIGLGCHVSGFRHFLHHKKMEDQVILVDLICHGTPSSELWKEYIHFLEETHQGKSSYITFKDKRIGWMEPLSYTRIHNTEIPLGEYAYWFYENLSQRDSCFHCPFTTPYRNSDITIGDYWGIQQVHPHFFHSLGTSLVLIQSVKGQTLFENILPHLDVEPSTIDACLQPRLQAPALPHPKRDAFRHHYTKKGIGYLIKHYHEPSQLSVFLHKAKKYPIRVIKRLLRTCYHRSK